MNRPAATTASAIVTATIFRPVRRAIDLVGSISDSSLMPSGVISNAPRKNQRNRKTEDDDDNKYLHHPGRRVESRQENRRRLNQQPGDDRIRDRDFVNITPLQLSEETHALGLPSRALISIGRRLDPSCARTHSSARPSGGSRGGDLSACRPVHCRAAVARARATRK